MLRRTKTGHALVLVSYLAVPTVVAHVTQVSGVIQGLLATQSTSTVR